MFKIFFFTWYFEILTEQYLEHINMYKNLLDVRRYVGIY